ncbi:MAG: DUF2252 family protein [Rudaea sp.]
MGVAERIFRFNAGRDADLLPRKFARIAADPFLFLRGTCHLFYADWHGGRKLDAAPCSWICGDLHVENMGSYKGDNRLSYFDLNDFDEAALAPCTWEIARFLVSVHVAARSLRIRLAEARVLCRGFLAAYSGALADGKPRWIERDLASGLIGAMMGRVRGRGRREFLDRRTVRDGKRRRFSIDGDRLLTVAAGDREALIAWMRDFAERQPDPKFFRPIDVARRAAGTGSLGLHRYAVLVRGNGSPNENVLLDLKPAGASSAGARLARIQLQWESQAQRVVTIQKRMQAIAPAFLEPVRFAKRDFVLRELQPSQDRLDLHAVAGDVRPLGETMGTMGRLVAWSALRGSGRQGAAGADDLAAFARTSEWTGMLVEYVEHSAAQVLAEWKEFRGVWQDGRGARSSSGADSHRPAAKHN